MDLPQSTTTISADEITAQRARVDEAWNILARSFTAASLPPQLVYEISILVQTEVTFAMTQHLVMLNKTLEEAVAMIRAVRKD